MINPMKQQHPSNVLSNHTIAAMAAEAQNSELWGLLKLLLKLVSINLSATAPRKQLKHETSVISCPSYICAMVATYILNDHPTFPSLPGNLEIMGI